MGWMKKKNSPFPKHLQSVQTKTDHAAFSCYFIVFFQQSYDEEVAASAQAWVDKCTLAHGPPSTRSLNGIFLLYFQLHTCATNKKQTKQPQCLKKTKNPQCLKKNKKTVLKKKIKKIGWRFRVTWPPMWLIASPNGTFSYLRAFVFLERDMISLKRLSSKGPLNEGCFIDREVKLNCWLCSHNRPCQMFLFFSLTQQVTWWVRICSTRSSCTHGTSSFLPGTMRCRTSSTQTYQPLASQSVTTHR